MVRTRATPSRQAAPAFLLINCLAVAIAFHLHRDALLEIVFDPTVPGLPAMRRAITGYGELAAGLCGVVLAGAFGALEFARERFQVARFRWLSDGLVIIGATALGVFTYVDARVFSDYGVHTYDFDVFGIVFNTVFARDLGIHTTDIVLAIGAGLVIGILESGLMFGLNRAGGILARWRIGSVALGLLGAMTVGGGVLYGANIGRVSPDDRSEFDEVLPFRGIVLLSPRARPYLRVEPRVGGGGYPVGAGAAYPVLNHKTNLVFFLSDAFRADLAGELAPRMNAFGARPEVLAPRHAYSSGHTTEHGVFGLMYGVNGYDFFPFLQARIPSYPLSVLRANGYVTALIAVSRFAPHPTDQLTRMFDQVLYPATDADVAGMLGDFIAARRRDQHPYLVMTFFYATHWPFPVQAGYRKYTPALEDLHGSSFRAMDDSLVRRATINGARNGALEADGDFQQTFDLIRDDYDAGRTALLVTSDHGTDLWEHGTFGHGRASFWNGKFLVPFFLGLPGQPIPPDRRTPDRATHLDLWPTLFDYLDARPRPAPTSYSDGLSLLTGDTAQLGHRGLFLTGRYFPWADRPNALVLDDRKYWFHLGWDGVAGGPLAANIIKRTDLLDGPAPVRPSPDSALVFDGLTRAFWKFLQPTASAHR